MAGLKEELHNKAMEGIEKSCAFSKPSLQTFAGIIQIVDTTTA